MRVSKNLVITIIILCFFSKSANSQTKWLDSAFTVFHKLVKDDTAKFNLLRKVTFNLQRKDQAAAVLYGDTLVELAKRMNRPVLIASAYNVKAYNYLIGGKIDEAIKEGQKALSFIINNSAKDALLNKLNIYMNLGEAYRNSSKYDKAFEYYNKRLDVALALNDTTEILISKNGLATSYMAIADWNTALDYLQDIKRGLEQTNRQTKMSYPIALLNIGNIRIVQKKYDDALNALQQAIEYSRKGNYKDVEMYSLLIISELYHRMKNYEAAYLTAMQAHDYYFKLKSATKIGSAYKNLGRVFRDAPDEFLLSKNILPKNRFDTAEKLLTSALQAAEKMHSLTQKEDPLEDLSILYEKKGDYAKAYDYYKKFKNIHDSLGNTNQQKSMLVNDMQYRFGRQTDSLKFAQALSQSHLQQQLSDNRQQFDLANKDKELQQLLLLKTSVELENTSLENTKNTKELALAKKEQQLQQAAVLQLAKEKELSSFKLQQQKIFAFSAIALLMFITGLIYYSSRLRRNRMAAAIAQDKAEQQLKEAEQKNKLNDITLSALRSQMNPHFIFNCLNSIKLYTMENNIDAASDYISKFSKLIRSMLDNSRNDRVTLASEIEALKLYVELEAMRFKNKLHYVINVDKNIDLDFVELPPLLVQPYIENAIWHGLMPKPEGGKIEVNITQNLEQHMLSIEIVDDGIGREKSALLNSKKQTYHKSIGTKVTGERIALINEKYKSQANVITHDVYVNGKAAGTQVIIQLPLD